MDLIQYAVDHEQIASITFNRDDKRNAVNQAMAVRIMGLLEQAESDGVRVVLLRAGRGAKVWCAGHDLSELDPKAIQSDNPTLDLVAKIQSTPLPVVAMVEGSVFAGGLLILLSADIVVATTSADVAITSNKLGIPLAPELYAFWLRVMGIHKAKELLFTGAKISAQDAWQSGLYNHVVQPEQLETKTYELARHILQCTPEGVANSKHQLNLIAIQSALSASDQADIEQRNQQILHSAATQQRIETLLASLRTR